MSIEKRFFVVFTDVSSPGNDQQDHCNRQHPAEKPRPIKVTSSLEDEQHDWIRDCSRQEYRHLGQRIKMGNALSKAIRALHSGSSH